MLVNYKLTEKKHWHIQGTVPSVRQTTIARDMLKADSSAVARSGLKWKFLKNKHYPTKSFRNFV